MRISFTGEICYEINIPASYALSLWNKCISLGEGGGGHGLTTAYYLAKNHGIKNIAVVEKGWIGGGNTGRNTTIIRSNYLWDQSAALYEHALKLWEGMSQELNYNVMFSQRGVMNVAPAPLESLSSLIGTLCPEGAPLRVGSVEKLY